MFDVITIGSALQDFFGEVAGGQLIKKTSATAARLGFELDDKISMENLRIRFGGAGVNAAMVFAKLGLQVAPLVQVGRDSQGKNLVRYLLNAGLDTSLVKVADGKQTGLSFLIHEMITGEHLSFNFKGASDSLALAERALPATEWIYLSGLTGGTWQEDLDYLAKLPKTVALAWNPGLVQIGEPEALANLMKRTEVLQLNHHEAVRLLRITEGRDQKDVRTILKKLADLGPRLVLLTHGKEGTSLYDGHHWYQVPLYRFESVDATGAGDAFGATFTAGLMMQKDFTTALKMAAINAGAVTREWGAHAGLMKLEEIESHVDKITVTEL